MNSISFYEKRAELRRVLQSKHFAKAKKKSRFLEFVCEQSFLGDDEKLNEYLIGVEVYGRATDFNPQDDAIVRVQAHEIRHALREYYQDEGKDSPFRIDLPPGHYLPVFTKVETLGAPATVTRQEEERRPPEPLAKKALSPGLLVLLVVACSILSVLYLRERARARGLARAQAAATTLPESMEWFWRPFLPPASPPLVVIPNHPLLRAAHEGDTAATLAHSHLVPKEKVPEFRDTMQFRELKGFYFVPSTTDFTAVGETLGLLNLFELFRSVGQRIRVKPSRLVDFEEIKRGNVVLLGGNQSWSGRVFLYPEGFWFQRGIIHNMHPRPGEQPAYKPEFDPVTNGLTRDYALVLMLPNESKLERILLIYGIYTQGSQAAIQYVTAPEHLQELRKELLATSPNRLPATPKYFQALLATTVENYVPGKISLVAVRVIPEAQ